MKTTTTPSLDALHAEHRAAEAATTSAHAALREKEREIRQLARTIDPPDNDSQTADVVSRLEAQLALGAAKTALQQAQLAAHRADAREAIAKDAIKAAVAAEVHERRRQIVSALARALLAARPHADALSLLHLEAPFTGDQLLWPSLQSRTTHFESVLTSWLAAMANYDLLDAETLALVRRSEAGDLLPAA